MWHISLNIPTRPGRLHAMSSPCASPRGFTPTSDRGTHISSPKPRRPPALHSPRARANRPRKSRVLVPERRDQTRGLTHTRGQPWAGPCPPGSERWAPPRAAFRGLGGAWEAQAWGLPAPRAGVTAVRVEGQQDRSHWAGPHLGAPPARDAATRGRGGRCRGLRSQACPVGGRPAQCGQRAGAPGP